MAWSDTLEMADRAILSAFGESDQITYTPTVGDAVDLDAVFTQDFQLVEQGQAGVVSSWPAVFIRLADLGSLDPESDTPTITVRGVNYTIREVKKDGEGSAHLLLHKV